jgi:(p)ppGpp synthase/HD superfamily hydrolase
MSEEIKHIQSAFQKAIKFAAEKHAEKGQLVPGTRLPYVVHLSNVAMEIFIAAAHSVDFDLGFAVQVALLHDTLEDTNATVEELSQAFGSEVARGVLALTKNDALPREDRMRDSLKRIKEARKEVWAVKLADRITNLQAPPKYWNYAKKIAYRAEAEKILEALRGGNSYLEERLQSKIEEYRAYIAK